MSFEDKVILITGASSGIAESALLVLVGRDPDKFATLLEKLKANGIETEPFIIYADVTVDGERIISETIEKYGKIDCLINNAGFGKPASLEDLKIEDYDAIMNTNVRAVVELTQLAIPHLTTGCSIINVSSIAGIIPIPEMFAYSMSKAGVDHFTKCAAMELAAKGIRVNSVNPYIDTNFYTVSSGYEKDTDEYNEYVEQKRLNQPLQQTGQPEDCVNAIAFLADNNRSKFITGILMPLDGGVSTKGLF